MNCVIRMSSELFLYSVINFCYVKDQTIKHNKCGNGASTQTVTLCELHLTIHTPNYSNTLLTYKGFKNTKV